MSRSTVGASGKDTINSHSDISHLYMSSSNEAPISSSDATADEASARAANRAATTERNEQKADKRSAGEENISDDEVLSERDLEPDLDREEEPLVDDDEFSKLQGLSPDDFKIALNFSINRAAEAGYAVAIGTGGSTSKDSGLSSSKSSSTFLHYHRVSLRFSPIAAM
ncbi:hypothetical protein PILCRDRAFT_16724 [Piloderma croceum F 1598]|uniref:Uncharacterized protein n=1 Tax=Piloderma croceum (strain F 1598) TaxID=765440 RepID=A0A0C3EGK3_PILCF|nr:hypothetical protein PILCRDRAFT_16724 [Piloderma croceum F 1598]